MCVDTVRFTVRACYGLISSLLNMCDTDVCSFSDTQTDMQADEDAEKFTCRKNSLKSAPICAPSTATEHSEPPSSSSVHGKSLSGQFSGLV